MSIVERRQRNVLLCGSIPNTRLIGVYRIKPDNSYGLERLSDPFAQRRRSRHALQLKPGERLGARALTPGGGV